MKGIITEEFELMLKKNISLLVDFNTNYEDLKEKINDIKTSFSNSELDFIHSKIDFENIQLDNTFKKNEAYQNVLKSVYNSYLEQVIQISNDMANLEP